MSRIPLRPDHFFERITDIPVRFLKNRDIRFLLLDIDGTMARTKDPEPDKSVIRWTEEMKKAGMTLYILSNNKSPERVERFCGILGINGVHKSKKPGIAGFENALRLLGAKPSETALIGDQIFTDSFGARRSGILSIRVKTLDSYLWYFPFRRACELPFLKPLNKK